MLLFFLLYTATHTLYFFVFSFIHPWKLWVPVITDFDFWNSSWNIIGCVSILWCLQSFRFISDIHMVWGGICSKIELWILVIDISASTMIGSIQSRKDFLGFSVLLEEVSVFWIECDITCRIRGVSLNFISYCMASFSRLNFGEDSFVSTKKPFHRSCSKCSKRSCKDGLITLR